MMLRSMFYRLDASIIGQNTRLRSEIIGEFPRVKARDCRLLYFYTFDIIRSNTLESVQV